MAYRFIIVVLVITVHLIQLCRGRYCQEAVNSVKIVDSCPTSKIEWDDAARKKNCIRIALQQYCSPVEKFQYHCVINGYRNETLEVCAPARIIFGHCAEFNVPGGVIQDQWSTRCNKIFPICDILYNSATAFKYPDCYQLVSNRKIISNTTTTESTSSDGSNKNKDTNILKIISNTTTTESTPNDGSNKNKDSYILILGSIFVVGFSGISCVCLRIIFQERRRTQIKRKLVSLFNNSHQSNVSSRRENSRLLSTFEEQNNMCGPELPTRNISPAPSSIQSASSSSNIYQRKDASDSQLEELTTVRLDSDNICDPDLTTRNISPAPSSVQSASSSSKIYKDASDAKSDDPNVLQPNSDQRKDASDNQFEQLPTVQSNSDNMRGPEIPTRNISPAPSSIQSASSGSTIYFTDEDASDAKSDDPNVLQPISDQRKDASDSQLEEMTTVQSDFDNMCDPELPTRNISPAPSSIQSASSSSKIYQRKDASDNQSEQLPTVQSDSNNMCGPEIQTRNISPAPSSIQSASSSSTIYFTDEDASDAKSDDPNVLQPNSDQRKDTSDSQLEEMTTVQSDFDDTQEEHQLENGSVVIKEEMTLTIRG